MDQQPDWHALERADVVAALETRAHGLSESEARRRLERYGPNELTETAPPSNARIALHQFRSPLVYVLLAAAAVSLVLGEFVDAAVIAIVLLLNASIGFLQERQAEAAVRGLMRLLAPVAHVLRDGHEREIPGRDLVPGDLALLESGRRVPADLRLVECAGLMVDESLLTGESAPVAKRAEPLVRATVLADRANMAYAGTIVARGRGRGVVVATGEATEVGSIAERMREAVEPETPIQARLAAFTRVVAAVVLVCALLAFGIGIAVGESLGEMFLVAVALAVSAVPEGLPVAVTITLALGVRRMARRRAIVRHLPAVETLGSTTVIGSDKTGTLTENRMTVRAIWAGGAMLRLSSAEESNGATAPLPPESPAALTLLAGVLTNEAQLATEEDGEAQGDPTEVALLVAARRMGIPPDEARANHPVRTEVPFEPELQYSASVRERDGRPRLFLKGAPERVVAMCDRLRTDDGPADLDRDAVLQVAGEMAAEGLRVLGMAYSDRPPDAADLTRPPEHLTLLGFAGMLDPPRAGVREAIADCRRAGVRVVMITGDHAVTARAIGRDLGIADEQTPVVTGAELEGMDAAALDERVGEVGVYARVAPEQKLRIVEALRGRGDVVAVTGDGVNDAPALKAADIGVAMGKGGTDVAREAADMVLADDNFVSIYAAVEEGRVTFDNIRKVVFFLISTNAAEVIAIVVALALGWPLVLLPVQILWLNLITDSAQVMALAFEPAEPGVLERPPRPRTEGILTRLLWERTALAGVVMAAGALLLFRRELDQSGALPQAQTVALTTLVLFQVFQAGNARSVSASLLRLNPLANPYLVLAVIATLGLHVAALSLPPTRAVLGVERVGLADWALMTLVAASIVVAMELHKRFRRPRHERLGSARSAPPSS